MKLERLWNCNRHQRSAHYRGDGGSTPTQMVTANPNSREIKQNKQIQGTHKGRYQWHYQELQSPAYQTKPFPSCDLCTPSEWYRWTGFVTRCGCLTNAPIWCNLYPKLNPAIFLDNWETGIKERPPFLLPDDNQGRLVSCNSIIGTTKIPPGREANSAERRRQTFSVSLTRVMTPFSVGGLFRERRENVNLPIN